MRPGGLRGRRPPGLAAVIVLAPFFAYTLAFLLLPSASVLVGAFQNEQGEFTLANVAAIFEGQHLQAYINSLQISAATAAAGGLFGFLMAYAAAGGGGPPWIRTALTTFSGVAANFAGVPLAFAFIATLGTTGLLTQMLKSAGIDLYGAGFTLFSFSGLALTYLYFQMPLMILVIVPAIDGLRREWREAAANLGASGFEYWRYIGLPILWPSLLGAMVLLFGNAFAAYATPYALTQGVITLVTTQIGNVLQGNVLTDPHLGQALALGMIVVIAVAMATYAALQRRTARWVR
ncbi:MAG: ABC transporter permease subunit [Armatimonadota bacterium]|nr:ABC transporter permease subunit [Armatimonadota bacterium]